MKKKQIIYLGLLVLTTLSPMKVLGKVTASSLVVLTLVGNEDEDLKPGFPKSPEQPPAVYLDGHSLYFGESYADAVPVELRDASGNVVYSDYLPAGVQTLSLPTTLSGTYTLYIYMDNYIFAGQINL